MLRAPLNLVLLGVLAIITIAGFVLVPASGQLAVHWGLDGRPDATLPRDLALLQMPLATVLVWAIVYAIHRFGNAQRRAGPERSLQLAVPVLTAVFALVQLVIVLLGAGVPLPFVQTY